MSNDTIRYFQTTGRLHLNYHCSKFVLFIFSTSLINPAYIHPFHYWTRHMRSNIGTLNRVLVEDPDSPDSYNNIITL